MTMGFHWSFYLPWFVAFLALSASAKHAAIQEPITVDLYQDRMSQDTAQHLSASKNGRFLDEYQDRSFWFYNFTIGEAKLKTFVDTGSYDVIVIHGYKPSPKSKDLHTTFNNSYATTRSNGRGYVVEVGTNYRDIVGVPKRMLVPNQVLGVVTKRISKPPKPVVAHAEALMGLAQNSTKGSTRSWFHSLCAKGLVRECRFGLAFGTNKKGKQLLGGVDPSLYHGELTRTEKVLYEWSPLGDVILRNKTIAKRNQFIIDSGTTTILGPEKEVRAIFEELGVEIEATNTTIRGIYPCNKTLDFGFRFFTKGKDAKTFGVLPSAMAFKPIGNGKCYAALETVSTFNYTFSWTLGQAFMQGLYVDHDVTSQTMGFAHLKSPECQVA